MQEGSHELRDVDAWPLETEKKKKGQSQIVLQRFQKRNAALWTLGISPARQTNQYNFKRNLCCLKPPSLGLFVVAALGN